MNNAINKLEIYREAMRTQQKAEEKGKKGRKPENRPRPVFRVFSLRPLAPGLFCTRFLLPGLRAAKRNKPKRQRTEKEKGGGRKGKRREGARAKGPDPGRNTPSTAAGGCGSLSGGAFVFFSPFLPCLAPSLCFRGFAVFSWSLFFPPGAAVLAVCLCSWPTARALRLCCGGPVLVRLPLFSLPFPFFSRIFRPHAITFAGLRVWIACFSCLMAWVSLGATLVCF